MKKIISLAIVIAVILCGCTQSKPDNTPIKSVFSAQEEALEEYGRELNKNAMIKTMGGREFYIVNADRSEWDGEQPASEVLLPKTGLIVMREADSTNDFVAGSYESDGFGWGSLSEIDDGVICYSNYRELTFIDTKSNSKKLFKLDWHQPEEINCAISSVVYDAESAEYAVIYNVSSYEKSMLDGEHREWMAFSNDDDYGAFDARIEWQRFKADGSFIDKTTTEIEPLTIAGRDVAAYQPNLYSKNRLSLLVKSYIANFVACNFDEGVVKSYPCDGAVIVDDNEMILYAFADMSFTYSWYEDGEVVSTVSFEEDIDELTMMIGNAEYPLELEELDRETRTLKMAHNNVSHVIDFKSGAGGVEYDYSSLSNPFLTTLDGRYSLFSVFQSAGGEGWADGLVSRDNESGEITRLGMIFTANDYIVTSSNNLVIGFYGFIEQYDLATGEKSSPVSQFAPSEEYIEEGDMLLMQTVYDQENNLFLLICTEYMDPFKEGFNEQNAKNIMVYVYDESWNLLDVIDSKLKASFSLKAYGPYLNGVELLPNRELRLTKGDDRVKY